MRGLFRPQFHRSFFFPSTLNLRFVMRVLHLEDSVSDAELISRTLAEAWPQCQVRHVATREDYLTTLDAGDFDLILSDYTMIGFDGLSALELARVRQPTKPFIFLSGTIGEERAVDALQRGATDYVIKDRPARLIPAIRRALTPPAEDPGHRRVREELRQDNERFRQIAENVTDLIAMLDLAGRCLYCNPAYVAVVGGSADRSGANFFFDIHADDRARIREHFDETARTGQGRRADYRLLRPDGTVRFVEAQDSAIFHRDGQVSHILVVARDVTERRQADQRIREQAALLDRTRDAILVHDLTGGVTYWNRGAEGLYGWSAEEACGRNTKELWRDDPRSTQIARQAALFYGEWHGELRQRTKQGTDLVVQSCWTLMCGPDRAPTAFLVINTDITEKKRLEMQFARVQRMESIGLLAGGVAHDINNVLAPILTAAELLESMVTDSEGRRFVVTIEESARHGASLVRQLLSFARGAAGHPAELEFRSMLADFLEFLKQTFPRAIEVGLHFADEPWPVRGDATQLKQVLLGLCVNARDAMPAGGRITIDVRNVTVDEAEAHALGDLRPGPHVVIEVTDTGTGIPPEVIDKIFDPFFTTKEAGPGTGLGLSAVRGILKGHGGAIAAESELGHGATFRLYLPAHPRLGEVETQPPGTARERSGAGEGILVIDDDPYVADVLCALLAADGYQPFKAGSGPEGLALMETQGDKIALVLTDIMMNGMTGVDVIRALRERRPNLPIVAMSGYAGDGRYEEVVESFGVPLLGKPTSRRTLMRAVQAALAKAVG
jgi:PAS domain S-box-containing protein